MYLSLALLSALVLGACGGGVSGTSPTAVIEADASGNVVASSTGSLPVTESGRGPGPVSGYGPGDGTCDQACDGTGSGPGPGDGTCDHDCDGTGPGRGDGLCGEACLGPVGPDPADIEAILGFALQEEYRAQMLYESVLEDFGVTTRPFAMIANAEVQHASVLALLLERRGLTPPASAWSTADFPAFGSLAEACAAGAAAEIADAAFYDPYLVREDMPLDVTTVFTHLRAASLESHLPAFEACR